MNTLNSSPEKTDTEHTVKRRSGLLTVVAPVAALLAAAYLTTVAVAVSVPDHTDYAKASVLKHAQLDAHDGKKIVLVGGSNLAYGIDSNVLREATQCRVINMGMNGYFGVRFMLEEVKPYLRDGDIVVIAWEYDSFYKSVDGASTDLLMVTKANTDAFRFLTFDQKMGVLSRYPYVAQQKVVRLLGAGYEHLAVLMGAPPEEADPTGIEAVESLASFTEDGDLIGHLGRTWEYSLEDGLDMSNLPVDSGILPMMEQFVEDMEAQNVKVLMSWGPVIETFYEQHQTEIERLNAEMAAIEAFNIPRPAREYVFPASQHFDTVFHLNREGRAIRSQMLADDILNQFGDDAICNP